MPHVALSSMDDFQIGKSRALVARSVESAARTGPQSTSSTSWRCCGSVPASAAVKSHDVVLYERMNFAASPTTV
jgi:hypothetical protein